MEFHKPDFIYHGAAVQTEPRLYVLYYGTDWTKTETGRRLRLVLEAFFEGLKNEYEAKGESSWEAILKQYVNVQGEYGSAVYSEAELAPKKETTLSKVTSETVQSLVAEYIAEKKIKTERNDQFIVLPAPGSTYSLKKEVCSYHEANRAGGVLADEYEITLDAYAKDIAKCNFLTWNETMNKATQYQESTLVFASHEFAESVTDPGYLKPEWEKEEEEGKKAQTNAWRDETVEDREEGEIADLCVERERISSEKEIPYYHAAQQYSQKGELYANTLQDNHDGDQCQIKDPPAPTPPAPTAETEGADVGSTNATLHGSVNPEGAITSYYFEYGTTTGYGGYAPSGPPGQQAGWETSPVAVTAGLTGLAPATTYHYRLVAHSWVGTTPGKDHTFTTPGWRILTTPKAPDEHERHDELKGISCTSGTSCEAVGTFLTEEFVDVPLSESWNGTGWTVQSAQAPKEAGGSFPVAVSCSSSTACTATGSENLEGAERFFAERFSGGSWSLQTPATPETTSSTLAGVSCAASNECYTAGWYYKTTPHERVPTIERWNGSEWKILTTATLPAEDKEAWFSGISCAAAEKCMAVGTYVSEKLGIQPLIESLSGTTWTSQTLPSKELISAELAGVSCTAPGACTAVGHNHEHTQEALIARYNGTAWSLESSPSPTGKAAELEAEWTLTQVSCATTTVCVATGSYTAPTGEKTKLLGEVWDGTAWSLAPPLPRAGAATDEITGLSCPTEQKCFATGYTENSKSERESLAEELEGA